jgi:hypothetical protein
MQDPYWLPYPFCPPQSGHSQVIPLQVIPHWFSYIQVWQMENPHRQFQQNMKVCPQQWHCFDLFFLRFSIRFSASRLILEIYFSFNKKDSIYAFGIKIQCS